ncbi:MAG: purine-nucleoside phosphorylase [Acidimicrobiia bacterium]|nr:purine-nucleoside phosphorylase [Acidimicrobiia bacterium]
MDYDAAQTAAAAIADATGRTAHDVAVVLGSGLSSYAATLPGAIEVSYTTIPGFPVPKVEGHAGSLFSAELAGGGTALLFAGRVHTYEGWEMDEVVFGVRTAALAGCHTVLLTNAAGGVGDGLVPGDLVTIRDHLNMTGRNPLLGPNDERLGPRFPDMTNTYHPAVRGHIERLSAEQDIAYKEGVYAWFLGPTYETPAEVQMARRLGADLVGMSTVPEAIALNHMGIRVGGISLVTNLAAGISPTPLSHEEVTETAAEARERFSTLVDALLPVLAVAD